MSHTEYPNNCSQIVSRLNDGRAKRGLCPIPFTRNVHINQAIAFARRIIADGMEVGRAVRVSGIDYNCDELKISMGIKKSKSENITVHSNVKNEHKKMPLCAHCSPRVDIKIVMRLDSLNRPQYMYWCPECARCVLYKGRAFISKTAIEAMGIDIEQIEQVY